MTIFQMPESWAVYQTLPLGGKWAGKMNCTSLAQWIVNAPARTGVCAPGGMIWQVQTGTIGRPAIKPDIPSTFNYSPTRISKSTFFGRKGGKSKKKSMKHKGKKKRTRNKKKHRRRSRKINR